jgi:hypothetical protein
MRSSQTITLFSERPESAQRPSSFLISIVAHGGLAALVISGVVAPPRFKNQLPKDRLSVRHLDLRAPEPLRRRAEEEKVGYPGPQSDTHSPKLDQSASARQMAPGVLKFQTLVQPDLPNPINLPEPVPVPSLLIWNSQHVVVKTIVLPQPAKPTAAEAAPSLETPNAEVNLADVRISATEMSTDKLPMFPSNTSPVVVHGPDLPQQIPATTSVGTGQPTPAAVLSLSDLRMTGGTVVLPPGNESANSTSAGGLTPGKDSAQPGNGNSSGKAGGTGADQGGGANGGKTGSDQGSDTGSGFGDQPKAVHIAVAHDGQFGAVVVGDSLGEKYPEASALWSGRMVYTVYLHLGLAKSWIFQYSLPRSQDAAASGNATRIEAPWPFDIMRPDFPAGAIDADVLIVHGFVNKDGRFEELTVVFPPQLGQAQFLLDALKQWQFRPATQDGKNVRVEMTLIIPVETE